MSTLIGRGIGQVTRWIHAGLSVRFVGLKPASSSGLMFISLLIVIEFRIDIMSGGEKLKIHAKGMEAVPELAIS